jgi:ATP-dependent DNA helicase RecG
MDSIKPSIQKLQKFFRLEAERNYDDKSVMGGLANMLESWEAEARQDELPETIIQAVIARLRDYHRLSEDGRETALKGLWARVRNEFGMGEDGGTPPASAKPESSKTPATTAEKSGPTKEAKATGAAEPPAKEKKEAPKPTPKPERKHVKKREEKPLPEGPPAALSAAVTVLDGVGPKNAEKLGKLGINNLGDMLYHFPRRYDDYTQLKTINRLWYGEEVTVIGTVESSAVRNVKGGKTKLVEVIVTDGSGALRVNWFNQPWIAQSLSKGTHIVLSGKVEQYLGRLQMVNPEWEPLSEEQLHTNRIVPVYPLTADISQRWLRGQMNKVVEYWSPRVVESLPAEVRKNCDLMPLTDALMQVHFPDSHEDLDDARYRLAFDEIFVLQMGVVQQKRTWAERDGAKYEVSDEWLISQTARLPYQLTNAQQKSVNDIRGDLRSGQPMNRLLQGDVGSGKTVVAALGMGMALEHGKQAALLAPTSILAEQHYQSLGTLLTGDGGLIKPEEIRLLVGATPDGEKKEIKAGLEKGVIRVVIGTHALLEDPVQFKDLQMVVIDEQHRFGVEQRSALRNKGSNPHLLVMTATPIPRSLALTVYGDLDLTVMDEMPPGREPVDTHIILPRELERAYRLIEREVDQGRQAFIIYPLVEESENSESKAAVEEHQRLQEIVFPTRKVGLVHGRLTPADKDEVMAKFRDGAYEILVSTTVIEVGVDIPNANVVVVEGANRFGLAQLHQLRGRVGRGGGKAYCVLVPENDDDSENERLKAMVESNDGFYLAEKDLELRGPGDFLGTRQAGFGTLQLANMTNVKLIEQARNEAYKLLESDPDLQQPEHARLAENMRRFWQSGTGDVS